MESFDQIDLYPVTCPGRQGGRSCLAILEGIMAGGARVVQLRAKGWSKAALLREAEVFRRHTALAGVMLIINDHLDVALAVGAEGVHLGQEDLPVAVARRLAPSLIIGASTHSLDQALAAQAQGATYVNIGPIFPTTTKEGVVSALGVEAIRTIAPHLTIPFTVMGGINGANLDQVLQAGARRVAMVTAITEADDVAGRVRELRGRIRAFGRPRA